ncbi:hypothetical protein J2741_000148 [Methanolinea mesophila]|uniref:hypothetical protein n=1 Tax=Methanolinea mesophila TaxID=547055 RepID=UPI001AE63462|nr:hypothetical protein [Methanolinea mesophila]MBP1927601.1 hypothetical protein [Methanolinea mesophila]
MTNLYDKPPCCAADALRQVKTISVNGIPTGIAMMEKVFSEVNALGISDEARLKETLLEKVKVYNYVPRAAAPAYAEALLREYREYRPPGA